MSQPILQTTARGHHGPRQDTSPTNCWGKYQQDPSSYEQCSPGCSRVALPHLPGGCDGKQAVPVGAGDEDVEDGDHPLVPSPGYLLFTLLIPFFAVYILLGFHWVFGMAICKLLYTSISMGMFTSIFLLTLISLDLYTVTQHPIWSWNHHTVPQAQKLAVGVWLASFGLSTPNLAFQETHMLDRGRIICINNYALSRDWNGDKLQGMGRWVHLSVSMVWFLLGFLLPFCPTMGCYGW
ncbi:unnamed protein product [Caretta caretta]